MNISNKGVKRSQNNKHFIANRVDNVSFLIDLSYVIQMSVKISCSGEIVIYIY
ncbi:hypothetical protein J22TS3_15420 [Paenibacillus sp. J22TS3]|nr:hypothetical protein J22TS3_15420 [Paenibacillus sp. J22TS3]